MVFVHCHDWLDRKCRWALGVLTYFMLRGEMPFGSWRESELDTFAKIAKGQLILPQTFSPEAVDIIAKVLRQISSLVFFSNVHR